MNRFVLLCLVSFLLSACAKPASEPASAPKTQVADSFAGWLAYEDDVFKVRYPPGSEVNGVVGGKQDMKSPMLAIVPPSAVQAKTAFGTFSIQPDPKTKGMLLRDAFQSETKRAIGERGTFIFGPKEYAVMNGHCLGGLVITPLAHCPVGQGECFSPIYVTQCDGPDGGRFDAATVLSTGHDKAALGPEAQQEAATYERMLSSLEFKKP